MEESGKMSKILVVAPHPDDETLGCGGTLLKHKKMADQVYWLIVTGISEKFGFSENRVRSRNEEIKQISKIYDFDSVYNLQLPTTKLSEIPLGEMIACVSEIFGRIEPEVVYIPYRGDVHSDHKVVFDVVASCTKCFRYNSIRRVLAYETISETDFGINPDILGFRPNVFVNISNYLEKKIQALNMYPSELGDFPFPRSEQAVRSLARLRGVAAGCNAAEAFMLLKQIIL